MKSRARDRDMMKRIVNATATMVEIVIDTLAENIVRKGNVRETIWMIMIITKVETMTGTDNVLQLFSGLRLLHS